MAALALAMIAALALSEEASADGTGSYGLYGTHNHGQMGCGSGGRITMTGMRAAAVPGMVYGHPNEYDDVYYRAHLYRWNGSSWAYVTTDGWAVRNSVSTWGAYLNRPYLEFAVYRGYWKVTTEMRWYDGEWYAGGNQFMGKSGVNWAQGMCTYG